MEPKKLTDSLSVAGQVQPEEVEQLAKAGFKAIICNRPDDEEPGQPDFAEIAAAAEAQGLEVRHIPVDASRPVEMQKDAFARALAELPAPVLAYCRTGNRCTLLHQAVTG
ncbi:TIGR01244 family sulfur transferase [Erythrobacter westpacificensis]|uniref:TIGR01244 family sulfur transferase n=1 Tax=Erythrobacter westpacificensis TaxID=1055231 RepID=A0ABP9KBV5_9SPHN